MLFSNKNCLVPVVVLSGSSILGRFNLLGGDRKFNRPTDGRRFESFSHCVRMSECTWSAVEMKQNLKFNGAVMLALVLHCFLSQSFDSDHQFWSYLYKVVLMPLWTILLFIVNFTFVHWTSCNDVFAEVN